MRVFSERLQPALGQPHTDEVIAKGVRTAGYKFLTPETENRTHFFWMQLRNFDVPDYKMEDYIRGQDMTFQEDNVILSSIQREQAATGVVQQTWIAIDDGAHQNAPHAATHA